MAVLAQGALSSLTSPGMRSFCPDGRANFSFVWLPGSMTSKDKIMDTGAAQRRKKRLATLMGSVPPPMSHEHLPYWRHFLNSRVKAQF